MVSSFRSAGVNLLVDGAYAAVRVKGGLFFVLMDVTSTLVEEGGARFSMGIER